MTFDDIPDGAAIFIDANTLVFHFTAHPKYGAACARLLKRIEQALLQAFVSSHVLSDTSHRLMTLEAMYHFNWPAAGLAARLRRHASFIPNLLLHRRALHKISQLGIRVLPVSGQHIVDAADVSRQYELLTGDATIVAVMQSHGLTELASAASDFDRAPWITRYAPV